MLHVELVSGKVPRQRVEQRAVNRRVRLAEVVVRIDDPSAHQVIPDAIRLRAGKVGIFRVRDPVGQ